MATLRNQNDNNTYNLSIEAIKKINNIVDDVDGPYKDLLMVDCNAVYRNSRELTPSQLFVEFKSALNNHERAVFDDHVVASLERQGLINIKTITYKSSEVDLEGMLSESSLTEVFDTYIKYEPCYRIRTDETLLDIQDLYIRFEKTLLADDHLVRHYANAIALSNTNTKNITKQKPYRHLIISPLDNDMYLVMPRPIKNK